MVEGGRLIFKSTKRGVVELVTCVLHPLLGGVPGRVVPAAPPPVLLRVTAAPASVSVLTSKLNQEVVCYLTFALPRLENR